MHSYGGIQVEIDKHTHTYTCTEGYALALVIPPNHIDNNDMAYPFTLNMGQVLFIASDAVAPIVVDNRFAG